jgi:outer membrane lipoprotein SlyB
MKQFKEIFNGQDSVRKADTIIRNGYSVILDFGTKADPDKIQSVLDFFNEEYGIELSIRHAELQEVIEKGIIGAVSGAGVGVLSALIFGGPVGMFALGGTIIGGITGVISATLHITIYKYNGHTMMEIEQ